MRVRFLYPVPYPAPYAAWIQIFRTAAALRCGGDDVAVITGRSQAGHAAPDPADAAVPHARVRRPAWWPLRRGRLRAWIRKQHGVVILRGETGVASLVRDHAAWQRSSARPVLEVHRRTWHEACERRTGAAVTACTVYTTGERSLQQQEGLAVSRAAGLLCVSPAVREDLGPSVPSGVPVAVLPSGCDPVEESAASAGFADRPRDFLFAGKLDPKKGVGTALDAVARLPGRTLDVFGGGDRLSGLQRRAGDAGLADRVVFHGRTTPAEVRAALHRTKVALCPLDPGASVVSAAFSSPMKVIETLAAGAGLVATGARPVRDLLASLPESPLRQTVPPAHARDGAAWAAAMAAALRTDDPASRSAGLGWAAGYAWPARAERLRAFLQRVGAETPG